MVIKNTYEKEETDMIRALEKGALSFGEPNFCVFSNCVFKIR